MQFTSVKVTPAAQKAHLEKNPLKNTPASASNSASTSTATALADATSSTSKKRNATEADLDENSLKADTSGSQQKAKKAKA